MIANGFDYHSAVLVDFETFNIGKSVECPGINPRRVEVVSR